MAKSIEERAIELMNTLPVDEPKGLVYEAYKKGASDQRKIDIEKAWKVFEKYATYIHPRKGEETCIMTKYKFIEAMEKEQ